MTATGELSARRIRREDRDWIHRWFRDPYLNRELGPMDDEWLAFVLAEQEGVELVLEQPTPVGLIPVAMVGISWAARKEEPTITDIAVDPERRRQGIGSRALTTAMEWPGIPETRTQWTAFVAERNTSAYFMFTRLGWTRSGFDGRYFIFNRAA